MADLVDIPLPDQVASLVDQRAADRYGTQPTEPAKRKIIKGLQPEDLFADGITDPDLASCCLSGLWLLHNFLDASHTISQDIHSAEGSFWHAIMHRWEGDYPNSKYWYRRAGSHPVYECVAPGWDPFDFVDRCELDMRGGSLTPQSHQIAVTEWVCLFEYCWNGAQA